jgi:hypothetical protein
MLHYIRNTHQASSHILRVSLVLSHCKWRQDSEGGNGWEPHFIEELKISIMGQIEVNRKVTLALTPPSGRARSLKYSLLRLECFSDIAILIAKLIGQRLFSRIEFLVGYWWGSLFRNHGELRRWRCNFKEGWRRDYGSDICTWTSNPIP